jgi:hypothetical protein
MLPSYLMMSAPSSVDSNQHNPYRPTAETVLGAKRRAIMASHNPRRSLLR